MKVQFLGTGTSQGVPVITCHCKVCRSNDPRDNRLRCSLLVETPQTTLVIDCGPDFRQQMLRAKVQKLDAILITHEHNDHIMGLDDVRPFNFRQQCAMPIYAQKRVLETLKLRFAYAFAKSPYPGAPSYELHPIDQMDSFTIGDLSIQPLTVMHGEMPVTAFRIGAFAYITDMKSIAAKEQKKLKNLEVLVVNALHHKKHHSHLNLEEALAFAKSVKAQQTYFIHMSHLMGLHRDIQQQLDEFSCQNNLKIALAYDGLQLQLNG